MLKPQDLLVTFKILSYEIGCSSVKSRSHNSRKAPWVIFELWGRNVLVLNRLPHQNSQKISNYIINDQTLLRIIKL